MYDIILASTSPRRKEILSKLGLNFEVVASDYAEDMRHNLKPLDLAKFLSRGKAEALVPKYKNHLIIGADTFVALGDKLLGKPHTVTRAREMLKEVSGKGVSIITGFTIIDTKKKKSFSGVSETKVYIKKLSSGEIENYLRSKEPLDKAGAFAIQGLGAAIIEKIDGDYHGAMGLPLFKLVQALKKFGVRVL